MIHHRGEICSSIFKRCVFFLCHLQMPCTFFDIHQRSYCFFSECHVHSLAYFSVCGQLVLLKQFNCFAQTLLVFLTSIHRFDSLFHFLKDSHYRSVRFVLFSDTDFYASFFFLFSLFFAKNHV